MLSQKEIARLRPLLQRHHRAGFAWALVSCRGDRLDAEDVLQTAYLKILQGRARFDGRAQFKTWFFAVIRRTAADFFRRKSVRARHLAEVRRAGEPEGLVDSPGELVERRQQAERVRRALEGLPKRQREVLALVFGHDLSLREAAEVLQITKGAASRHYDRGKRKLRRQLTQGTEIDEEEATAEAKSERPRDTRIDCPLGAVGGR